jgi:hypothetical protein
MDMDNIEKIIDKGKEMLNSLSNNKSIDFEVLNSHIIVLKLLIALNPELSKKIGNINTGTSCSQKIV